MSHEDDEMRTFAVLAALPDNHGLRIFEEDGDFENLYAQPLKTYDLIKLSTDKSKMHIITMALRPGAPEFMRALEMRHYPPARPELNKKFEMRYFKWNDLLWVIASIPAGDKSHATTLAREYEMKISMGLPHMIGSEGKTIFPMNGKGSDTHVFTLEGVGGLL